MHQIDRRIKLFEAWRSKRKVTDIGKQANSRTRTSFWIKQFLVGRAQTNSRGIIIKAEKLLWNGEREDWSEEHRRTSLPEKVVLWDVEWFWV